MTNHPETLRENPDDLIDVPLRAHQSQLIVPALVVVVSGAIVGALLAVSDGQPNWLRWLLMLVPGALLVRYALVPVLRWLTTTTTLEADRVSFQHGILTRRTHDLPIGRITDVHLTRTLMQRVWGSGTLHVDTAGQSAPIVLDNLGRSQDVFRLLVELMGDNQHGNPQISAEPAEHEYETQPGEPIYPDGATRPITAKRSAPQHSTGSTDTRRISTAERGQTRRLR